ncbi:unnamed protein product [Lepeophtheirus salmonis]|uniref:(salmon louse) hypothetical protein n=1 Tax=Lepeophtheirus salmonis TaxID=72036 RepID=A0A7R8CTW6_LEPSM|nr:unnamed protein product [Lepeophtheirus salmonis]CAF2929960.1 unnamed protein product [Lepeophtheirus salmonis]
MMRGQWVSQAQTYSVLSLLCLLDYIEHCNVYLLIYHYKNSKTKTKIHQRTFRISRSYGVIGCMIYFLWSATALNSLVMIAFIQAKKIWKKNWGIFALLFQGICVIIIPSIILGLCIHFNDSGLKSFGAFIDATAYIQGEIWTLNFSNESDYFILLYFILTLIIFLVLGFACLIYNALTTYKDIRVKDMGMPGVAASYQIISSLELNLFKYKVAFVPFGFYMIAGYLFIDSQVSNDYEESRQAYYLIPLAFLLISNVIYTLSDGRVTMSSTLRDEYVQDFVKHVANQSLHDGTESTSIPMMTTFRGSQLGRKEEVSLEKCDEIDNQISEIHRKQHRASISDHSLIEQLEEDSDQEDYKKIASILSTHHSTPSKNPSNDDIHLNNSKCNFSKELDELDSEAIDLINEIVSLCDTDYSKKGKSQSVNNNINEINVPDPLPESNGIKSREGCHIKSNNETQRAKRPKSKPPSVLKAIPPPVVQKVNKEDSLTKSPIQNENTNGKNFERALPGICIPLKEPPKDKLRSIDQKEKDLNTEYSSFLTEILETFESLRTTQPYKELRTTKKQKSTGGYECTEIVKINYITDSQSSPVPLIQNTSSAESSSSDSEEIFFEAYEGRLNTWELDLEPLPTKQIADPAIVTEELDILESKNPLNDVFSSYAKRQLAIRRKNKEFLRDVELG